MHAVASSFTANLAFHQSTRQISTAPGPSSSYLAVDGNRNSCALTGHTNGVNPWLAVDLIAQTHIYGVSVTSTSGCKQNVIAFSCNSLQYDVRVYYVLTPSMSADSQMYMFLTLWRENKRNTSIYIHFKRNDVMSIHRTRFQRCYLLEDWTNFVQAYSIIFPETIIPR